MITFSAFADEIAPDLKTQMEVCEENGIRCIDVRGLDGKNVSQLTAAEAGEYFRQMTGRGFSVPCIGSPIGKITMDDDFRKHLDLLKNCCDVARAFGTNRIRVFSFYPSPGKNISDQRTAVMDRMAKMVELAAANEIVLYHENEKAIYGAKPAGVKDLFATIRAKNFKGIFDPANYVEEGLCPYDDGWTKGLAELTDYMHIKDKNREAEVCTPAGTGQGQFREILADLKKRNWGGFMTLEPHLAVAGQFQGFTGGQLFGVAVRAIRQLCDEAGLRYQN